MRSVGRCAAALTPGAHRAATGRKRRAEVTLCHYTSAELLQQRLAVYSLLCGEWQCMQETFPFIGGLGPMKDAE
ncbi:MAG TPA: hypothetical protein VGQ81_11525 [Acidobacteriota bacterium]|nr:hypothetical protein [Acidobacteriota bacterium]